MRLDDLVEPGVVLIDRLPDLDHGDAAVFHDGVVSNEAIRLTLRRQRSSGDLVVHLGGHARRVMLLENGHRIPFVHRLDTQTSTCSHSRPERASPRTELPDRHGPRVSATALSDLLKASAGMSVEVHAVDPLEICDRRE